jgi:7-carboxy-7-deazaguanine synthase
MQLIEHYLSIQGEGLHTGKLTYFVRFARCNLRCTWCDSPYSFGEGKNIPFSTIAKAIRKSGAQFVCLTGGEPLLHETDCLHLIRHFPKIHFDIETGGSLPVKKFQSKNTSVIMDWKLNDSGMAHRMVSENLKVLRPPLDLLKLVTTFSKKEKKEMLAVIQATQKTKIPISIQPVWGTHPKKIAQWLIGLKNPRVQFNLQLHKQIWPNTQRRV